MDKPRIFEPGETTRPAMQQLTAKNIRDTVFKETV